MQKLQTLAILTGNTQQLVQVNPNNHAYKYIGYPGLCQFMASDNDFFVLRRFGDLNVRVLLDMQHDIQQQENRLLELDQKCKEDPNPWAKMDSLAWDKNAGHPFPERAAILRSLRGILREYSKHSPSLPSKCVPLRVLDEHLATYAELRKQETAQKYQIANVKNWLKDYNPKDDPQAGAIKHDEVEWLAHHSDIVCIAPETKSPLVLWFEKSRLLRWIFRKKEKPGQAAGDKTMYWSDKWMRGLADSTVIFLGLLMLFGPMWWLNWVDDDQKRLGIITAFVTTFSVTLRVVSDGRPFEVLAATAA